MGIRVYRAAALVQYIGAFSSLRIGTPSSSIDIFQQNSYLAHCMHISHPQLTHATTLHVLLTLTFGSLSLVAVSVTVASLLTA